MERDGQATPAGRPPRRRRGTRPSLRAAAALLGGFLAALPSAGDAAAQPLIPGSRFNFNFSNPGARSLGFGGAFAALADDATASYANSAGLVQLARPEVSVEWRAWSRSPRFLAGGRLEGDPTGNGIDTEGGLIFGRDPSESIGPSFASVVIPRGRFSFAIYGHSLARYDRTSRTQGFFSGFEGETDPDLTFRSPALEEHVDLEVVTAGLAAAWRVDDRLRVGVSAVRSDVRLTTAADFFAPNPELGDGRFDEIPLTPDRRIGGQRTAIDDSDWTLQAGVLWRASERLSAGAFYRGGAEARGGNRIAATLGEETVEVVGDAVLRVPDVWGAGVAFRSRSGALTVAAEVDRVGYEGLLSLELEGDDFIDVEYQDAWEYHLGAEYALLQRRPILAFRVGGWVEANGDNIVEDRFTHLAVGFGLAADSFQVDLAADFSQEIDIGSVSFIYSF